MRQGAGFFDAGRESMRRDMLCDLGMHATHVARLSGHHHQNAHPLQFAGPEIDPEPNGTTFWLEESSESGSTNPPSNWVSHLSRIAIGARPSDPAATAAAAVAAVVAAAARPRSRAICP